MEEKRRISCIVCPVSCVGEVTVVEGKATGVSGFTCPRGQAYAMEEVTAPKRTLTSTVRIDGGELPLLPVVSQHPLPKDRIIECARCLATVRVAAPIQEGEVICADILGLKVNIVASRNMEAVH